MDLRERVAIVTGATGGLGRVVTGDLAAAGARLGLPGTRLDRLEALATELDLAPDRWVGRAADLTAGRARSRGRGHGHDREPAARAYDRRQARA